MHNLRDPKFSKTVSLVICTIAYVVAFGAAVWVVLEGDIENLFIRVLVADVVATVVIFIFSFAFNNSSLYDPYWSVAPVPIAWYFMEVAPPDANEIRQWLVMIAVLVWAVRLTANWVRGWHGLHEEDWRYGDLAQKTGKAYWLVSLAGIHLFPTLLVYLGCLPIAPAMASSAPLQVWDVLALLICIGAAGMELVADEQLKKWKKSNADPQAYMQTGVWSWSRHPNYFGEVMFWIGIFVFILSLDISRWYWTGVGALSMIILFVFISIPMMERRNLEKRPAYREYMRRVSMLIPLPPKK